MGAAHKRNWRWVSPVDLEIGDTVADFGLISKVYKRKSAQQTNVLFVDDIPSGQETINSVEIFNEVSATSKMFLPTDTVFAFTEPKKEAS